MALSCAEIAALIHADMCDDEDNGYSWSPRFGGDSPNGVKVLKIGGRTYSYPKGSYDCSSSVITAWRLALQGTAYEGALDAATYTGNMRAVFLASGLFEEWDTDRTEAVRGDVYLNDASHTAMCQDGGHDGAYGYDALSEFCINERGEVYGGKVGDQTGHESHVRGFYDYPWNVTMHYNGKADAANASKPKPTAASLGYAKGTYKVAVKSSKVRSRRSRFSKACGTLRQGDLVSLCAFRVNKAGNVWGKVASGTHKGRFVLAYVGRTSRRRFKRK